MTVEKIKILIVEDESIVAADLKHTLIKLNYQVAAVLRTGEEALQKISEEIPDLVLMDIMLSGKLTGIDTVQKMKENYDIPVIYLTAYADETTIQNAKLTEPYGYLLKPFDERTLHFSIEMALYKHKTDHKLKESEERYRNLVENSPIAIGIHSDGKIVFVNSAGVKLFGAISSENLIGKPIMDLVMPSFRDMVRERIKHVAVNISKLEPMEEKLMRLDGTELDVEVTTLGTQFEGKPAVQMIIRDISEVKKRERIHLATSRILQSVNFSDSLEQQYNYLAKTLIDFVVLKNFSIVLHNKPENSISYEYFNDEFDERPSPRKFSNGLIEYTINSARSQLLNKAAISELLKKNEVSLFDKLPAVWMGVPIPISENLTLVFVFKEYFNERYLTEKELELINAVTLPLTRAIERKMIEEENKLTLEKLEESNQTKDNFFSIVSHDLRSPFNSIIGFTEILKQDFDELSKDELKTYINSIYDTSKQINNLLNNLLQYSKFKLGKFEFIPAAIDLKNTIAKNVDILKGSILKKEIKVREDIAENLNVCADENMINSILLNLLTNAIKFSHRGGIINLKAFNTGKSAQIEIKDFGVGMDELTLNKIFKLDSKKVIPGTENELGTGLGLLLVKEFTEKHGGSIYVESKAGKGSTFSITLPLAKNSK